MISKEREGEEDMNLEVVPVVFRSLQEICMISPTTYRNRAGDVEWEGSIDEDFFIPLIEKQLLEQTKEIYKKYVYDWGT